MTRFEPSAETCLREGSAHRGEATLIEIRPLFEPRHRNWESTRNLFRKDQETLRTQDPIGCSALELAEAMDRFLAWRPGSQG
jgi:hypothetical protein